MLLYAAVEDTAIRFGVISTANIAVSSVLPAIERSDHEVVDEHFDDVRSVRATLKGPIRGRPDDVRFDPVDQYALEVDHFVDCVESGRTPIQNHTPHI